MSETEFKAIQRQLDGIRRLLEGNGQPGMVQTVAKLETRLHQMESDMVSKEAYRPVQLLVFGGVALALTAVATALVASVLR